MLSEDCVIARFVVYETGETVKVELHYWAFPDEVECEAPKREEGGARRFPLGEREFVVQPLASEIDRRGCVTVAEPVRSRL
jgi:hypothetical protein